MKTYTFFYPEYNITQHKLLISHEDYLLYKDSPKDFKALVGDNQWFTDNSPLYHSISSGVLLCNGVHKVEIIK